jgi:rSAM/selenodomain-associated transferase 2
MSARLSVIIPVLDEANGIAACLLALASLRAAGAEVIVADGGSQDGTAHWAAPHADHVVHAPRGRARQMNAGAAIATGDVLLFLHADTQLPHDAADHLDTALATGAQWGRFDVRIDGQHPLLRIIAALINLRSRLSGIATGDQAIFVRRQAFAEIGGFPDLPLMEDIALSDALRKRWKPACIKAKVTTSGRRWERHGVWRTIILMWALRSAYRLGVTPDVLARHYR